MLDAAGLFDNEELEIPELFLLESAIGVTVGEKWDVYASGTNLLNEYAVTSWRPFGARPIAPRQIMVGVKRNGL